MTTPNVNGAVSDRLGRPIREDQRIIQVLDRMVQSLFRPSEFFNDVVVNDNLLAVQNNRVADDGVVEVFEEPRRRIERSAEGHSTDHQDRTAG